MNASTEEQPSSSFDTLKWGVIFLLLAAAVAGNYVYGEESVLIRAIAIVVMVGIAFRIFGILNNLDGFGVFTCLKISNVSCCF